jgi:hypothetical protein
MRITKEDKLKFWRHYKHVPQGEFVKMAREAFGYSKNTIDQDIYNSFCRFSWDASKTNWPGRLREKENHKCQ